MLVTPRALLLDFGGVITDGPDGALWTEEAAGTICALLSAEGVAPPPREAVVAALLADGRAADASCLLDAPTQRSAAAHWAEVVAAEWPAAARDVLAAHGAALSRRIGEARFARYWRLRPGMAELVADAAARGLPLAVVSNTICGQLHREFLERAGLARYFAAQLYSDEQGVRKPNPELVRRATAALGVEPVACWFVGDTLSRDVLVARRAGAGCAVLMRSQRIEQPPHPDGIAPDAVVEDPVELHALLSRHW